jgi:hypothetical protein
MRRWFVVFTVLLLGTACTHRAPDAKGSTDRTVLLRDEFNQPRYANLYDAISALRRNWLVARGADSFRNPSQIRVYLDNVLLGGTDVLKNMVPSSVTYMKFYDGIAATTRWGTDHGAGAIYLSERPVPANP